MDLVHANAREIELSRVAFHQANSPAVSSFARHMLEDHRTLQDQLISTYGGRIFMRDWPDTVSHNYTPEDEGWVGGDQFGKFNYNNWAYLYGQDWQDHHMLENLNGSALDSMYVSMMATDHAMLLAEINRCDRDTSDDAIKTIISTVRPTVEMHLNHARDLKMRYQFQSAFNMNDAWN
jgi:predicted outer membrane protein